MTSRETNRTSSSALSVHLGRNSPLHPRCSIRSRHAFDRLLNVGRTKTANERRFRSSPFLPFPFRCGLISLFYIPVLFVICFLVQYSTMQYILVTDAEDSETMEVPSEDDGSLSVSSLAAHYPGATGLKYRVNGHVRAVKLTNGKLYAPEGGWQDITYYCIFPKGK